MNRRRFLTGLVSSLVAAPAVVSAASLMPIRGIIMPVNLTASELVSRARDFYSRNPAILLPDDLEFEIDLSPGAVNRTPPFRMMAHGLGS